LFLSGLKEALKTRGARVKKKDLRSLFCYIGDYVLGFLSKEPLMVKDGSGSETV
jgi:hypothetical protein